MSETPLATLPILVGMFFVLFGEYKVFGTDCTLRGGFEESGPKLPRPGRLPVDEACSGKHYLAARAGMRIFTAYGELMIGLGLVAGVLARIASGFGIILMALLWASVRLPRPACRPMALLRRFASVVRFYRVLWLRSSLANRMYGGRSCRICAAGSDSATERLHITVHRHFVRSLFMSKTEL